MQHTNVLTMTARSDTITHHLLVRSHTMSPVCHIIIIIHEFHRDASLEQNYRIQNISRCYWSHLCWMWI